MLTAYEPILMAIAATATKADSDSDSDPDKNAIVEAELMKRNAFKCNSNGSGQSISDYFLSSERKESLATTSVRWQ
jgi:hypothetical protein